MVLLGIKFTKIELVIALVLLFIIGAEFVYLRNNPNVLGTSVTSGASVSVNNVAPVFTVVPAESPSSGITTTETPLAPGTSLTFSGTATDANGNGFYLAICKTNSITPNAGAGGPTCGGGSWCISSSATATGVANSCSYSVLAGDAETSAWYGFACDNTATGQTCSTMSQGTGNSGSPFYVNHAPTFTAFSGNSAVPGGTITFSTTASDTDVAGSTDNLKLIVCSTNVGASYTGCTNSGDNVCSSTTAASNPSCTIVVPNPAAAATPTVYGYIFDTDTATYGYHHLASTANPRTTTYTISNAAPVFSVAPAESPASGITTTETPLAPGASLTFSATATDTNSNGYYLAICKTNAITPNAGVGVPTCGGGSWCVASTPTATGVANSCNYTVLAGDAESSAWYAFACDNPTTGQACSSVGQGSGNSGSPFFVNHAPTFGAFSANSAAPGGVITFSSTSSDSDTQGSADNVKLIVCSTNVGATYTGCTNGGDNLGTCSPSATNASCSYTLPAVVANGTNTVYGYVFDTDSATNTYHHLASTSNPRTTTYTVTNSTPAITNTLINGGSAISLNDQALSPTTTVPVTFRVTDANGCSTITSSTVNLYLSTATCTAAPNANSNSCYPLQSCTNNCTTGAQADYTCNVPVAYLAEPTVAGTNNDANTWKTTVNVTDTGSANATDTPVTGVEMNTTIGIAITPSSIGFGSVDPGTNTGATNQQSTVSSIGNVGIDTTLKGNNFTSGSDTIPISNLQVSTAAFTYPAGTAMTLDPTTVAIPIHIKKSTVTATPESKLLYWGIGIPLNIPMGTYTTSNTITAGMSPPANW